MIEEIEFEFLIFDFLDIFKMKIHEYGVEDKDEKRKRKLKGKLDIRLDFW
jgi:hypothetical protein